MFSFSICAIALWTRLANSLPILFAPDHSDVMLGWNHFSRALCARDSAAGTYFHPARFSLLEGIASFGGQNSDDLVNNAAHHKSFTSAPRLVIGNGREASLTRVHRRGAKTSTKESRRNTTSRNQTSNFEEYRQ
jgi:hypothetical protein